MQSLRHALQEMLGDNVGLGVDDPKLPSSGLWPAEQDALPNATSKRQAEFAGGRRAARQAMAELGVPASAVPHGVDRAPVWPDNLVGSIAHSDLHCIGAVALRSKVFCLGIDIETAAPLDADLIPVVCTQQEQDWLRGLPAETRGINAMSVFCAKEAVYKAQYPLTQVVFGYDAITLQIADTGRFEVEYLIDLQGPLPRSGQIRIVHGQILAVVCQSVSCAVSHRSRDTNSHSKVGRNDPLRMEKT